jgi:hypothetical protein
MTTIDPSRLKPWIGDPPRTSAPEIPGYVLVAHERFNMGHGAIAGFVLIPVWTFVLVAAIGALGGRTDYAAALTIPNLLLGALIALALVPVLHEVVHGLVAILLGARPSYGIGPGFAYTTFREPMGRAAYLTVGLAPLVVLSAAGVALAARWDTGAGWCLFFAVVNASGAVGDLWMSWRIVRQPRGARYVDLADGFAVLLPERHPAAQRAISHPAP